MENKSNIDEILKKGYEYLKNGDIKKTIQTYADGLEASGNNISLINNLAQVHAMNGDSKKSREYHMKLIELADESDSVEMMMLKANSQMCTNSISDAVETFKEVLRKTPLNVPALFQIAEAYARKEDFRKSNRYLNRILDLESENTTALIKKAKNLHMMGDIKSSLKTVTKALEISPRDEAAIRLKGEILKQAGDEDSLKRHIAEVLEIKPTSAYTLMLKAMECANENREKKAMEFFNRAITADPELDEAYFNKAGFLMLKKRYDEAIECYRKAFEINPESGGITNKENLFELLNHMKNTQG